MSEGTHYCTGCGEQHGGRAGESEQVKIAKINADRDIEVARLARSETRIEAEAQVEAAEVVSEAAVEQTEIEAAAVVEVGEIPEPETGPEPGPEPGVVETPDPEPEPGPAAPPETEPVKPAAGKPRSWWDSYSA